MFGGLGEKTRVLTMPFSNMKLKRTERMSLFDSLPKFAKVNVVCPCSTTKL